MYEHFDLFIEGNIYRSGTTVNRKE